MVEEVVIHVNVMLDKLMMEVFILAYVHISLDYERVKSMILA